jgi:hypothetical protein
MIFACNGLKLWIQTEFGRCMSPLLSLLCMSAGFRTSLVERHCFHATLIATPPLPYRTNTQHDKKQAFELECPDVEGPASLRSSHVCEINTWLLKFGRPQPQVAGLSVSKTKKICKQSRSDNSRRSWETWGPWSVRLNRHDKYISGIYLEYIIAH